MTMSFCSFSSGSSGNCYLVKSETTAVLVDAGISCKKITEGLAKTGTPMEHLKGILITHEHVDHINGVKTTLKKNKDIFVHANEATFLGIKYDIKDDRRKCFQTGDSFVIGDMEVETFAVSHDAADPVGYIIRHEGKQIGIVTDTGVIADDIIYKMQDSDILVIEANHDIDMLRAGSYPDYLKQRILGRQGHLSNEDAGKFITKILKLKNKARCILLAHLSSDNNRPETAEQTIINILEENGWDNGTEIYLKSMLKNEVSTIYEI